VWAEVAGVRRPDEIEGITGEARLAIIYERLWWGIPSTFLPIISLILVIIISSPFILRAFHSLLEPISAKID
jgi:hypothetical protein